MFKWLSMLTKKRKTSRRKNNGKAKSKVLDGIRADILNVSERLNSQSLCVDSNSTAIEDLQKQVSSISTSVLKLSATLENAQQTSPTASATLLTTQDTEEFTHLQEACLIILWKLAGKDGAQWVSMRMLVSSIYPGQEYNRVRTTTFEHIRIFERLGLIHRIKRGNRTFIALTKKGVETAKKKLANKKEKLLQLPEIET